MSRRLEDLNPIVTEKCRSFIKACKERGIHILITSTLRTKAEQEALFAQGRKGLDEVNRLRNNAGMPPITESQNKIATKNLTSLHQFGYAFDVAIMKNPPSSPFAKGGDKRGDEESNPVLSPSLEKRGGGRFEDVGAIRLTEGQTHRSAPTYDIKADLNDNDIPDYEEIGAIGEALGLRWGGRFKFKDYVHFEYTGGLTIAELKGMSLRGA